MKKTICILFLFTLILTSASAQDWARERLNDSPRHHEWVTVEHDGRQVEAFLAFPEVEGKAPAIVVIHQNRGLNDVVGEVVQRPEAFRQARPRLGAIGPDAM